MFVHIRNIQQRVRCLYTGRTFSRESAVCTHTEHSAGRQLFIYLKNIKHEVSCSDTWPWHKLYVCIYLCNMQISDMCVFLFLKLPWHKSDVCVFVFVCEVTVKFYLSVKSCHSWLTWCMCTVPCRGSRSSSTMCRRWSFLCWGMKMVGSAMLHPWHSTGACCFCIV